MPFCTSCGAPLAPDAQFCEHCGAPVEVENDSSSDLAATEACIEKDETAENEAGSSMDTSDTIEEQAPQRSLRARRVVAIAGAIALVLVVIAVFTAVLSQPNAAALHFGSPDAATIARTSVIKPQRDDGSSMGSYRVRIVSAKDADGNDIDLEDASGLEVADDEGFTLDELMADAPAGTYQIELETDEGVREFPPLTISDDASSQAIEVSASSDGEDVLPARRGASYRFLEKLNDLEDTYGTGEIRSVKLSDSFDGSSWHRYYAYADGLAFADLLDFGDGVDRLLVVCCSPDNFVELGDGEVPTSDSYHTEVWEYEEETDELICVLGEQESLLSERFDSSIECKTFDLTLQGLLGGGTALSKRVLSEEPDEDGGYIESAEESIYGASDDGTLGELFWYKETISDSGPSSFLYRVNGQKVSEEQYDEAIGPFQNDYTDWRDYDLAAVVSGATLDEALDEEYDLDVFISPRDALATVDDVRNELEHRMDDGDEKFEGQKSGTTNSDDKTTKYDDLNEVASALVSAHGDPSTEVLTGTYEGGGSASFRNAVGTSLRVFVDLNHDGVDELVAAYRDHDDDTTLSTARWNIEVWATLKDGEVTCVHRGTTGCFQSSAYLASLVLYEQDDGTVMILEADPSTQTTTYYTYYSYDGGDQLVEELSTAVEVSEDGLNDTYYIDGGEVDEILYNASCSDLMSKVVSCYCYSFNEAPTEVSLGDIEVEFNNLDLDNTLALTRETIEGVHEAIGE